MDLQRLNKLGKEEAAEIFFKCCGTRKWINEMVEARPFRTNHHIFESAEKILKALDEKECLEAFQHHPKIGDINSLKEKYTSTKQLAENEQSGVNDASMEVLEELSILNHEYEKKFGYIFIICASGKTADEMLAIIKNRINNDAAAEIKIAMKEQNKITKLRMEKLL
ncbi:MAG: 2-oxo-4-hydroxy-4-carboxy-5-ureidoimidazoline decarboxylase [Bacteroidota bacterium]|nr:2-oxo-4-hydroxy-4-carboxy-5-ureidoimidazoline decarboxylase [Bacteroidota bacterium]